MHRFSGAALILLAMGITTSACNNSTTTTTTTTPTPTNITDTFTGVVTSRGSFVWPFAVPTSGTVIATLTSIAPDSTIKVGMDLGTWNGSSCQLIITNPSATQGSSVAGQVSAAGNLCVRISDSLGLIPVAGSTFQIDVNHP